MKRLFVLTILILVVCFNASLVFAESNTDISFSDVSRDFWGYDDIMTLARSGIISGYEDGTYKPDKYVTREEFVKLIFKANSKEVGYYSNTFMDVDSGRWSYDSIKLYGHNIADNVRGYLYFRPSEAMDRKEAAKLIVCINNISNSELTQNQIDYIQNLVTGLESKYYDLSNVTEEYLAYIYLANLQNIMQGMSTTSFSPNGYITRAQAAAIIRRVFYNSEIQQYSEVDKILRDGKNYSEELIDDNNIEKLLSKVKTNDEFYLYKADKRDAFFEVADKSRIYLSWIADDGNESGITIYLDYDKENVIALKEEIVEVSKIFGIDLTWSDFGCTLKYKVGNTIYYTEGMYAQNSNYIYMYNLCEMIAFVLSNNMERITCLKEKNIEGELEKFISKYIHNKGVLYCEDARLNITKNKVIVSYEDLIRQEEKTYALVPKEPCPISIEELKDISKVFKFPMIGCEIEGAYVIIIGNQYFCAHYRPIDNNIYAYDFNQIFSFIISNSYEKNIDTYERGFVSQYKNNLRFEDIIVSVPRNYEEIEIPTALMHQSIMFDRIIENVDIDIINSRDESVMLWGNIVSRSKYFQYSMVVEPGEDYRIIFSNFVDEYDNSTPINEEYIISFSVPGKKVNKTGKKLTKAKFDIPQNLNYDSEIVIKLNGDINGEIYGNMKNRQYLELIVGKKGDSYGFYRITLSKLNVTVEEILKKLNKVNSGDEIVLQLYFEGVDEYIGTASFYAP